MPLSNFIAAAIGVVLAVVIVHLLQSCRAWKNAWREMVDRNHELSNVAIRAEVAKQKAEQDLAYNKSVIQAIAQREVLATLNDQQFFALQQAIVQTIRANNDPEQMS